VRSRFMPGRTAMFRAIGVLAVLGTAAALRLVGIGYDRPFDYHPDEWLIVKPAMHLVATGDPNPHVFFYPTLLTYLVAALVEVIHALTHISLAVPSWHGFGGLPAYSDSDVSPDQFTYVVWGRRLVAGLGVLTVLAVLAAGLAAGRTRVLRSGHRAGTAPVPEADAAAEGEESDRAWVAALAAAAFMAVAVLGLVNSRYLTTDVPSSLFAAATLAATLASVSRYPGKSSDRFLIVAGLMAGLAAAAKYNAGTVAIVPAIGYMVRAGSLGAFPSWLPGALRSRTPYLAALAAVAGFVIANPMILFDTGDAVAGIAFNINVYNVAGHVGYQGDSVRYYIDYLWTTGFGPVLSVLAVAGISWALLRHRAADLITVVFVVIYFILVSIPTVRFERNLMPLVPFVSLLAGRFVADLAFGLKRLLAGRSAPLARVWVAALLLLLLAQPAVAAAGNAQVQNLPDTRSVALEWVDANLPSGTTVVREAYTPQLSATTYKVGFTWTLSSHGLEWYRSHGFRYAVASSLMYSRYVGTDTAEGHFYTDLFALPTVYRLNASAKRQGPSIVILDLGRIGRARVPLDFA
jgi:hypothetical protein